MGCGNSKESDTPKKESLAYKIVKHDCRRHHMFGIALLFIAVCVLAYLIYSKIAAPKTIIGLDLASFGLANPSDMVIIPDLQL